ncbi:MAG TPA: hypothetical protein VIA62_20510 [Thermoanaerobaculia bacterium]|jgi:hypothetical protein|nr:hypothetical protein [Thermoanaerobaculia bacterium]
MRIVWLVLAFVGGLLLWLWLATGGVQSLGAVAAPAGTSWWVVLGGYLATILGVVLGSVYRELARLRDQGVSEVGSITSFLRHVMRSVDFLMSVVASPLVYALILRGLGSTGISSYIVIGIQNGFACLAITSSFLGKQQSLGKVEDPLKSSVGKDK